MSEHNANEELLAILEIELCNMAAEVSSIKKEYSKADILNKGDCRHHDHREAEGVF